MNQKVSKTEKMSEEQVIKCVRMAAITNEINESNLTIDALNKSCMFQAITEEGASRQIGNIESKIDGLNAEYNKIVDSF